MSRRRYRIGIHHQYDTVFDRLKASSIILNPVGAAKDRHPNTGDVLFSLTTKHGLEGLLKDYSGDEQGMTKIPDTVYNVPAILPKAEQDLQKLITKFNSQNKLYLSPLPQRRACQEKATPGRDISRFEGNLFTVFKFAACV